MSDTIQIITSETEFENVIQSGVALVDFYAMWCGPCKAQMPILSQVANDLIGKAKVVKIDTDQLPSIAVKYDVSAIPTLIVFKDGNIVDRFTGIQQAATLKTVVEKACS